MSRMVGVMRAVMRLPPLPSFVICWVPKLTSVQRRNGDELFEIGIGEHEPRALPTVADEHVAERARGDVAGERPHRASELARGFGGRAQAVGRPAPLGRAVFGVGIF